MVFTTGNNVVDQLESVQLVGNVVPSNWYRTITIHDASTKPDAIAILILADIVYWYRPVEVRDELSGRVIGLKKKIKADFLQRNYDAFAEQLGFSKCQVQNAIKRLEEIGVITRVFRNIKVGETVLYNSLFLPLHVERLMDVTFSTPSLQKNSHPPIKKEAPLYKKVGTSQEKNSHPPIKKLAQSTKSTPENTTEIIDGEGDIGAEGDECDLSVPLFAVMGISDNCAEGRILTCLEQGIFDLTNEKTVLFAVREWLKKYTEDAIVDCITASIIAEAVKINYVNTMLFNKYGQKQEEVAEKEYSAEFEGFWKEYFVKKGKSDAYKCFVRILKEGKFSAAELMQAGKNYGILCKKNNTEIKHASTFLGIGRHYLEFVDSCQGDVFGSEITVQKEFDRFWGSYPKKIGLDAAYKVFSELVKGNVCVEDLVKAGEHYGVVCAANQTEIAYMKNASGFLSDGYYKDYVTGYEVFIKKGGMGDGGKRTYQRQQGGFGGDRGANSTTAGGDADWANEPDTL